MEEKQENHQESKNARKKQKGSEESGRNGRQAKHVHGVPERGPQNNESELILNIIIQENFPGINYKLYLYSEGAT